MKQKLKEYKGITLIALIITIIVLLILAVVAISVVNGNGILNHAQNSKIEYSQAQTNEQATLDGYLEKLNTESAKINGGGSGAKTLKDSLNKVLSTKDNTPLTDEYENKITVPAGFKILVDDTTNYTADNINVTKGIVVEDGEGNQFVWIPVGTIYTNTEKTESKIITLGRYEKFTKNEDGTYTVAQDANAYATPTPIPGDDGYNYMEYNTTQSNAIAKDIGDFCTKANLNGGYYIGRYEARTKIERKNQTDDLTTVTLKVDDYVYNYVSQSQASERCQNMYTDKPYESDLVNSYAWDTAIIFFQEFGEKENYANETSVNSSLANTGTSGTSYTGEKDVICNVYDMASNCYEWSTETCSDSYLPCALRGGSCDGSTYCTSSRNSDNTTDADVYYSFRPLLYM